MVLAMLHRCLAFALRVLPAPAHRALDAWSYRVALKRRKRRLKLAQSQ